MLCQSYWAAGTLVGSFLGRLIPFDLTGIDFCMTALFVIILIDQWEKGGTHGAALTGLLVGAVTLLVFGGRTFMMPALLLTSAILLLLSRGEAKKHG